MALIERQSEELREKINIFEIKGILFLTHTLSTFQKPPICYFNTRNDNFLK